MHEGHDLTEVRLDGESIIYCLECDREISVFKGIKVVEDDEGRGTE